jgi:hypothetical protein
MRRHQGCPVSGSELPSVIPASPDTDTSPVLGPRRRPRGREAKGADAPARRLRAALMSHHQGPMVSDGHIQIVAQIGIDRLAGLVLLEDALDRAVGPQCTEDINRGTGGCRS